MKISGSPSRSIKSEENGGVEDVSPPNLTDGHLPSPEASVSPESGGSERVYAVPESVGPHSAVKLTEGKRYEVLFESRVGFDILDDAGQQVPCFWRDCAFGGDWTRITEPSEPKSEPFAAPATGLADGYRDAFYQLAELMGIPARTESPQAVWEGEMLPRLREAFAASAGTQEAVAVIGKDWALQWASPDTLAQIVSRTGIKIGSRLYAALPSPCDQEKLVRHDERKKIIARGCIHTRKAGENADYDRPDVSAWQHAQGEYFDPTICEIVSEYAAWRDQQATDPKKLVGELEALAAEKLASCESALSAGGKSYDVGYATGLRRAASILEQTARSASSRQG